MFIITKGCQCSKIQWVRILWPLFDDFLNKREGIFVFFFREKFSGNFNKLSGRGYFNIKTSTIGTSLILNAWDLRTFAWSFCVTNRVVVTTSFTCGLESEILIVIIDSAHCDWVLGATKGIKRLKRALEHFELFAFRVSQQTKKRK